MILPSQGQIGCSRFKHLTQTPWPQPPCPRGHNHLPRYRRGGSMTTDGRTDTYRWHHTPSTVLGQQYPAQHRGRSSGKD